jgi:FtsH-binding integral membrane protein
MHHQGALSIWFFIGILLTAYGILITGSGIYNYNTPPANVTLSNLHAPLWWGLILLLIGLVYLIRFFPKKR